MKTKTRNMSRRLGVGALILAASVALGKKAEAVTYYPANPSNNTVTVDKDGKMTGVAYKTVTKMVWDEYEEDYVSSVVIEKAEGNENLLESPNPRIPIVLFGSHYDFRKDGKQNIQNNKIEINGIPVLNSLVILNSNCPSAENNILSINDVRVIEKEISARTQKDSIGNKILISNVEKIQGMIALGRNNTSYHDEGPFVKCNGNIIQITGADTGVEINNTIQAGENIGESGEANENKVIIKNIKNITVPRDQWEELWVSRIIGGEESFEGEANKNEVNLVGLSSGASVNAHLWGGHSHGFGSDIGVRANGNIVSLENILMGENTRIVGGFGAETKGNTINISGVSDLSKTVVAGGVQEINQENGRYVATNSFENRLNIGRTHEGEGNAWVSPKEEGNRIKRLEGIQNINFYEVNLNSKNPALRILEKSDLSKTKFSTENISFKNKKELEKALKIGAKMILIDVDEDMGIREENILTPNKKYMVGRFLETTGTTAVEENDLVYKISSDLKAIPETHNILVGHLSGITALQGGENFIEKGVSTNLDNHTYGLTVSVNSQISAKKHETGSYVKTDIWNQSFGVGNTAKMSNGDLAYMAFFENGNGDYRVKSEVGEGRGDVSYKGLALASKYRFNNDLYTSLTLRVGEIKNEGKSLYTGASVKLGKVMSVSDSTEFDIYGKYSYMKMAGDDIELSGDEFKFDAVDSSILTGGVKVNNYINNWNLYAGVAIEQEFSGKATGTVEGVKIKSADVSGATVLGEIGAKLKVSDSSPWTLDFGIEGSAGKHKEIRGNFGVTYSF